MSEDKNAKADVSAIVRQNKVFSDLLANIPVRLFCKDAETGVYLYCNQGLAEFAGKSSPDEVIGRTDDEIYHKSAASYFRESDLFVLSSGKPYTFANEDPDPGEHPRVFQTTKVAFVNSEGRKCILGVNIDVIRTALEDVEVAENERRQHLILLNRLEQEEKNRDELERMITALSADYRAVYRIDLDTNEAVCLREDKTDKDQTSEGVTFPYLERFTWYAENSVAPSDRGELLDFIDPESIREELAGKEVISCRYLVRRAGMEYYEQMRIARIPDGDGDAIRMVSLGLTVVDKQTRDAMAINAALSEALTAAKEASKAKTSFLSSMSHEIRTPLNAIIGLDNLALRNESLPAETVEYLRKIGESANHLLGLINDILDMSRIESGRMVIREEEFSLRESLEQINTMVMSQCVEKGLKYECIVSKGVDDYYVGDDLKLRQILINILGNAVKFTDAPGSVTLTVERTASFGGKSTLRFSIKDTGIGMDESFIPKIFEPFTQEHMSRKNRYGSTGLGMAITKNLVAMMNGVINVTSEKGKGTEFTVALTLREPTGHDSATRYVVPEEMLVLIVDGDADAAEHTKLILNEVGIKSDIAPNGKKALRMLKNQFQKRSPYDLVLLDQVTPQQNAIDIAKHIRLHYDKATTAIILVSYNWDDIRDEAVKAGVDSFLSKPLIITSVLDEFEFVAHKNKMVLSHEKRRAELGGKHILLAEDVPINAEIIIELLSLQGATVDHAENGRQALDMFAESEVGHYDAVLMDVRMPVMHGLEATVAIRALDRADAKTTPIIAMTANAFDEDVQRSLQAGMNAHLSKPVEPERLFRTLGELIWEAQHTEGTE